MSKTIVTGGTGLLGTALQDAYPEGVFLSSKDCDLRERHEVIKLFKDLKPETVIHTAARVGGVKANNDFPADFVTDNVLINTSVFVACQAAGVKKIISILSTCVYPNNAPLPLEEGSIHDGEPHPTNFAYAHAKRLIDVQAKAFYKQHGLRWLSVIPNNLFGENDNFSLGDYPHVLPALIRKIYEAKKRNEKLVVWGDGEVYREFTYAKDTAKVIKFLDDKDITQVLVNVGDTEQHLLKDVVVLLCKILNFRGEIVWDVTKPKGQIRKPSSNKVLKGLGCDFQYTPFKQALRQTCEWFLSHYQSK